MQTISYHLIDNTDANQYEFRIDEYIPRLEYIRAQNSIYLTHTEVPIQLEGKGVGSELVKQALLDIEKKELTLVPLCPFVALYLKRHPSWRKLVMKGITVE